MRPAGYIYLETLLEKLRTIASTGTRGISLTRISAGPLYHLQIVLEQEGCQVKLFQGEKEVESFDLTVIDHQRLTRFSREAQRGMIVLSDAELKKLQPLIRHRCRVNFTDLTAA